jgi:hypothetical protein
VGRRTPKLNRPLWILLLLNMGLALCLAYSWHRGEPHSRPLDTQNIQLLAEVPEPTEKPTAKTEIRSSAATASPPLAAASTASASPAPATVAQRCFVWQNLNEEQSRQGRQKLLALWPEASLQENRDESRNKFWVHIPAPENEARLKERLTQLKEQAVDAFAMPIDSPAPRAISLGLFSKQEMAENFLAELKLRGVSDASIKPHPQSRVYSLKIGIPSLDGEARIKKLVTGFDKTELQTRRCE